MTRPGQGVISPVMHSPRPPEEPGAAKRRCRAAASQARARAQGAAGAAAGAMLAAVGLEFLGLKPATVSGFRPFADEIDVLPLMARLAAEGWRTALPVVAGRAKPLVFRAWAPGEPTVAGAWSIPVPPDSAPEVRPDVLLVPMLAFDRAGFRLGYGGGFYDRTLSALRASKPVVAVGVAFAGQEIPEVPREAHDEPLDWILTEHGAIRSCG
jgi:5-formyltetrahydrofolate cyclo-ligase